MLQYKLFLVNNLHTGEVAARQDSFSGATSLNKAQSILFTSLSHNERQALVLRGQPAIFQKPLGFMSISATKMHTESIKAHLAVLV